MSPSSGSGRANRAHLALAPNAALALACGVVALLAVLSLFIGVSPVSPFDFAPGGAALGGDRAAQVMVVSRIPRTLALILAGMSLGVAGLIMQLLASNRFAEPSTIGADEFVSLGLLMVLLLAPGLPVLGKMAVAAGFGLAGMALFLALLRRVPLRSPLMVPLIGLMLGAVVNSVATFIAYRYDLLQSLGAWTTGDFSAVLRGRYELLWIGLVLTLLAAFAADRFTVAGLGQDFAVNLGLNYRRITTLGLIIVALVTAAVVVSVGMIPFLGLVIPNVVSLFIGDNARRAIPWIAVVGAGFVLACDIVGRTILFPYEIAVGATAGVIGAVVFVLLVLRRDRRG